MIILFALLVTAACIRQGEECVRIESPFESLNLVSEVTVTKNILIEVDVDQMGNYAHGHSVYCLLNTSLTVSDEWGERILKKRFFGNAGSVSFVFIGENEIFFANWNPVEASNVSYEEGVFLFCK
ncbi:MAG: hypothetical protein HXS40_03525 [Theionarchaea archaeon]|nr:hypothetical protein [Theionarchaea archaeon]